jgi:RHS repeat-associated protein
MQQWVQMFTNGWDVKNRLTSVAPITPTAGAEKDIFTYDGQDRRIGKDVYTWDAGSNAWAYSTTFRYVYDGCQIVAMLDGNDNILQAYAWGQNGTLLSITDFTGGTPQVYAVVTDAEGSVVSIANAATGLVAATYSYDVWGNPTLAQGLVALSPFRWQGELYDASFNRYYLDARECSATARRFLSADPSGEQGDENLYRPFGNDPVNESDPTGLRYDTIERLWNQINAAAYYANNPGQLVLDHPVEVASAAIQLNQTAVAMHDNPMSAQVGGPLGVLNGAARIPTSTLSLAADAKEDLIRVGAEFFDVPNDQIDLAVSLDSQISNARGPDQVRSYLYEKAVQGLASQGLNEQAVRGGAVAGEVALNLALLATSFPVAEESIVLNTGALVTSAKALTPVEATISLSSALDLGAEGLSSTGVASTAIKLADAAAPEVVDLSAAGNAPVNYGSLTPAQVQRIQTFVNNYNTEVSVVGSRAAGTAGPLSDFDYVIGGNARLRSSAQYFLPKGAAGGALRGTTESGIDIFNANNTPLDPTRPFIKFTPGQPPKAD